MALRIQEEESYKFVDEGSGEILLLLHGLFGALSNWDRVVNEFKDNYRVIIPLMPIYEQKGMASVDGLTDFIKGFVKQFNLTNLTLLGNSLGGHVGLVFALSEPERTKRLVLTGSSGLFENSMGGSFPKRGNYDYIKERVAYTFYDPKTATKDLIDEVFDITNSISKCMRIVSIAKSAQRHNMAAEIPKLKIPTLLIWGLNDMITPPEVAHEFEVLLPHPTLKFIDKCGHAPMMERPDEFNGYLKGFLKDNPI